MSEERVIDIIANLGRKKGFLSYDQVNLVVTDRRLIVAQLTYLMIKDAAAKAASEAKGAGVLGRMAATFGGGTSHHERYRTMTPEAILAETPGNLSLDAARIESIKLKGDMSQDASTEVNEIIISGADGKVSLRTGMTSTPFDKAREILKGAFGPKVK